MESNPIGAITDKRFRSNIYFINNGLHRKWYEQWNINFKWHPKPLCCGHTDCTRNLEEILISETMVYIEIIRTIEYKHDEIYLSYFEQT